MTMTMTMTGPKLITHVYVFIFSFIGTAMPATHAQQSSPPPDSFPGQYSTSSFTLAMTLTLVFVVLVFVVTSLVAVCINRFTTDSTDQQPVQQPRELNVGLDPALVEMFPVVDYVSVKGIKIGNGPLECAVCLSEFVDDDKVRLLLPGCCHAFHPDCIDGWLKNHITCPVCRSDLTHNAEIIASENNLSSENGEQHLAVAAVHRFTLRLPEHVQRDIEASRGEQRMAARIAGHQYEILPASKSGKVWSFLRVFSSRQQPDVEIGEGSVRREGSIRREGSVRSIGSIRREGSVRSIAQVANFHSGSLRSGSLRLSSSKEEAEPRAGSVARLSPTTAPPVPCLTDTGTVSAAAASGTLSIRSSSVKSNPELAASRNSAPPSPSERCSTDSATLNRA